MGSLSPTHWLIVLAIVVLVFGTSKLKNLGKDLGGAVKGFKDSMKEVNEEEAQEKKQEQEETKAIAAPAKKRVVRKKATTAKKATTTAKKTTTRKRTMKAKAAAE